MVFSPIKTVQYQLYLFQLENYNIRRFFALIKKNKGQPPAELRKSVVWTLKLTYLFVLSLVFKILASFGAAYAVYRLIVPSIIFSLLVAFLMFYALSIFFFVILIPVALLYAPLDYVLKQRIIARAKTKMSAVSRAKVIGITGSYGKTTMKEVLAMVVSEKFNVLKTPENINTPLGVSRLIQEILISETQIFIVEMGAYQKGDIKAICDIAPPDISMVTGINESHLERFGSIENTIAAKFEIVDSLRGNGLAVLNADDQLVTANYLSHIKNNKVLFYSAHNESRSAYRAENITFFDDGSGIAFHLSSLSHNFGLVKVPFLGEYIVGVVVAVVALAKELGMSDEEIKRGIAKLKPISHRLELIRGASGVLVIDDSYNGNPNGVHEAIQTLSKFMNRRKVYITPGLVEMGEKTKEIHYTIGRELAGVADLVILIKNSVTPYISEALEKNGFLKDNIVWFDSAQKAHSALPDILQSGDVVMFQNDWPDNYF